jgi:hypothetical protein
MAAHAFVSFGLSHDWTFERDFKRTIRTPSTVTVAGICHLGNLNASLFTTEGIASVGLLFAPLSALICGFSSRQSPVVRFATQVYSPIRRHPPAGLF